MGKIYIEDRTNGAYTTALKTQIKIKSWTGPFDSISQAADYLSALYRGVGNVPQAISIVELHEPLVWKSENANTENSGDRPRSADGDGDGHESGGVEGSSGLRSAGDATKTKQVVKRPASRRSGAGIMVKRGRT